MWFRKLFAVGLAVCVMAFAPPPSKQAGKAADISPHKVRFVATDDHVKLEVLDWGGAGRPLVLLAGLGATAHVFDAFAPQLAAKYHVYGVTRRGYGASERPDPAAASYMADRLGDDVLAVIGTLKLQRPVLAGWSIAGEELSSIGSRHPEKVAGLIYLDAAYAYAFYATANAAANLIIDTNDLRERLALVNEFDAPGKAASVIDGLLQTNLPQLEADLLAARKRLRQMPATLPYTVVPDPGESLQIRAAILAGQQKYTAIKAPILAIFAIPSAVSPLASLFPDLRPITEADETAKEELVKRFEAGNPSARVVRLPNAEHAIFTSNPADVLREMTAFIDGLQ